MSFEEATQHYNEFCRQYHAQQLSYEDFCNAVNQLRVQDAEGHWWQLSLEGQWLQWNGVEWAASQAANTTPVRGNVQFDANTVRQAAGYATTAYGVGQALATGNAGAALGRVAGVLRPLAGKTGRWWNIVSILGGGASGSLWYWYSTLDNRPDSITAAIMCAVPIILVVLRKPIDRLLAPLMPIKQRIPKLLIIGVGIAIPYLVATLLYDKAGLSNYPYIRWSVFLGPLLSYMVIRTPNVPTNLISHGVRLTQQPLYDMNQLGRR